MLISDVYRGLIYAGDTALACSIVIEQIGPMELMIRKGTLTTTGDRARGIAPQTITLAADLMVPVLPGELLSFDLRADGIVCAPSAMSAHPLIFPTRIPADCTDLANVEIPVLTVRPGFPEGTTAADWTTQHGVVPL